MLSKEREGSIKAIKENKKVKVILISFKAGSTGKSTWQFGLETDLFIR